MSKAVYEAVTNSIVEMMEQGVGQWNKSWISVLSHNLPIRANGQHYRGINTLILAMAQECRGFKSNQWMTYKQASALGGQVRKGAKSEKVVYFGAFTKEVENAQGDSEVKKFPLLRQYSVFNVDEIDGLPSRFYAVPEIRYLNEDQRDSTAEGFFDRLINEEGLKVSFGHSGAWFMPSEDRVGMPEFGAFESSVAFYGTYAHECIHWTSVKSRLDRSFTGSKRFGGEGYATEELVAELGSAFVMARLGLEATPREDHAQYLASWVKALKADAKAIFTIASHAQKATDYLFADTGEESDSE